MAGINKVIIIGHLGRDPEIRYTPDGTPVANFSVATSEQWTDKKTGEKREKTEWHRIVVWRKLAELCSEYLSKGRQVYIEGKLQTRSWEDDGVVKYQTDIVANQLQFLGGSNVKRKNNDEYEEKLLEKAPSLPKREKLSANFDDEKTDNFEDLPF